MKNKFLTIFALIILGLSFAGMVGAETLFSDDFESYNLGKLNVQGDWTTNHYNVSVVDKYGSRMVKITQGFPQFVGIEKSGQTLDDGRITIYLKRIIGGTTNPQVHVQLKEGSNIIAFGRNGSGGFAYYGPDQKIEYIPNKYFSSDIWFAYQIEWRSLDHKVRYGAQREGEHTTFWSDWVSPFNEWENGIDKVYISVSNGILYVDNIRENPISVKTPVLIVPGLTGTEIFKNSEKLWPDGTRMMLNLTDDFMDSMQFGEDLKPIDSDVFPEKVVRREIIFDYTEGLINEFGGQGYVEGESLFTFPYDWRYGVTGKFTDGKTNVDLLKQKIEEIKNLTGKQEVDIIAHSLGGLLVKKYVVDNPQANYIGKAVFVGVPNTGAPKSIKVLLQGDNLGVLGLNDEEIKKISKNMPGVYDLLPSLQYYNVLQNSFVQTVDRVAPIGTGIENLDFEESREFLINHSLNQQAIANGENLHTDIFDNFDLRTAGVDLYSIVGCRAGTLEKVVEVKYKDALGQEHTVYDRPHQTLGDNTVPFQSATNLPIDGAKKYYALFADHGKMPSQDGIRQQIVNILSGSGLDTGKNIFGTSRITQDISRCKLDGRAISVFSPVNIFITDQSGNRLGLAEDGSLINEIPNADFQIWGERKFVYLPEGEGQNYNISLQGTGSGTFTIKSQTIEGGSSGSMEVFSNLSVTPELLGEISLTEGQTQLILRKDQASEPEIILASAVLEAGEAEDLLPPISSFSLAGDAGQENFYRSSVIAKIEAEDDLSGVLNLQYSLNGADFVKADGNAAEVIVAGEGEHVVKFFATDKAGNNELEKTINFIIDKTPPEAVIEFDFDVKDLKFSAVDAISVEILDNDDQIILIDKAGNKTEIKLKEKQRKKKMNAEIKFLAYNGVPADISKNSMVFGWQYDKKGNLKKLEQKVKAKKDYNVNALFDGKQTKITGKDSSGKLKEIFSGVKVLKITTSRGDLNWSY